MDRKTHKLTDGQKGRHTQTDRWPGRQTHDQTDRQEGRQTDRQEGRHKDKLTDGHRDCGIDGQLIDGHRLTHRWANRHT